MPEDNQDNIFGDGVEGDKQFELVDYLTCPTCSGSGVIKEQKCSECSGQGVGLWLNDFLLYWDRPITNATIFTGRLQRIVSRIVDAVVFLLGLTGLVVFIWHLWPTFNLQFNFYDFIAAFSEKSFIVVLFWLSLVADMFLFYRFNREQEKRQKIQAGESRWRRDGAVVANEITSWSQVGQLESSRKIEVSKAYSEIAFSAIERAYSLSRKFGHDELRPIHLLAGLLTDKKIRAVLARLEVEMAKLQELVLVRLRDIPVGTKKRSIFSMAAKKSLIDAYALAYQGGRTKVDLINVLLAISRVDDVVGDIFYELNADWNKINNVALWIQFYEDLSLKNKRFKRAAKLKPKGNIDRAMTALRTPFLDQFSQNLTTMAKFGYFTPCIGREKEIEEIFRIIESGQVNNVILVGENGVGKTTIIQGIAQKMVEEDVPKGLQDKRLMSLSISALIGGTTPDVAQARLLQVISEINKSRNVVLVIENIRELTGITVGGEQSLDLAGVLNQELMLNPFVLIATATRSDYVSYIEKNDALKSILYPATIDEVDKNGAIQILETRAANIEYKNKVYFSYTAIEKAVDLSSRYIRERYLPEKAIQVMEQAAILAKNKRGKNTIVSAKDVAEIVAEISNIPSAEVSKEESAKLLNLEERIHERLIGQVDAVKMVAAALRRARAGMGSATRPISNLLFLGPTGVGKTELAKTIAEVYFGDEKNMIRLDMSEYQGVGSLRRLIGAEGDTGGFFTEAVRKSPFSLVLLDEIEKANQDVINVFLQVMEDGRLTDNSGRVIDFSHCIIIATSNAGTEYIQSEMKRGSSTEVIRQGLIDTQLKAHFRPEFLNRFDGVMVFKPLTSDEVNQIARLMLDKVGRDLESKGVGLMATDAAIEEFVQEGFDPALGARPLRRVIQNRVRDALARLILENKVGRRDVVIFDAGGQVRVERPEN